MSSEVASRLAVLDFERDIQRLTEDFTGRKWLLKHIDDWLAMRDERFFILTGEPGVGKSAVTAHLTKVRDDIIAYHFCIAGRRSTSVPSTGLRSLAAQMGDTLPGYGEALANTVKPVHLNVEVNIDVETMIGGEITSVVINHLYASDPEEEMDILLRAPLAELPEPPEPLTILVDSLDEAVTYHGDVNLVTLLSKLDDLPRWVRFLCTTRPERRVLRYFDDLAPYVLAAESQMNLDDIHKYIVNRVGKKKMKAQLKRAGVESQELVDHVAELSDGNFLYTKILLNDIEAGQQPLDDLAQLPKSLPEIYHDFLTRFTVGEWEERYQPILGVLAAAQEPLNWTQLVDFTGIQRTKLQQYLGVVRQFLDEDTDEKGHKTYRLFHQSLRDYLLDKESNEDFWCAPEDGHLTIADHYLKNYRGRWSDCDLYGLRYLPIHLIEAGRARSQEAWVELERVICDLEFVEAKCAAGMTFDLIADYNYALTGWPRAQTGRLQEMKERLAVYRLILIRYSDICQANPSLTLNHVFYGLSIEALSRPELQCRLPVAGPSRTVPWLLVMPKSTEPTGSSPIIFQIDAHVRSITSLSAPRTGDWLVSGGEDGAVYLWGRTADAPYAQHTVLIPPDPDWSKGGVIVSYLWPRVCISRNGDVIAAVLKNRTLFYWNRAQPMTEKKVIEDSLILGNPVLNEDGSEVVIGPRSNDLGFVVLELPGGRILDRVAPPPPSALHPVLAANEDLSRVVIADWGAGFWIWDRSPREGSLAHVCSQIEEIKSVAISPAGDAIVIGTGRPDYAVILLRLIGEDWLCYDLGAHREEIAAVGISDDTYWVASAGHDGNVCLWDVRTDSPEQRSCFLPQRTEFNLLQALVVESEGREVIVGGNDGVIYALNRDRWQVAVTSKGRQDDSRLPSQDQVDTADIDASGRRMIWANRSGEVWIRVGGSSESPLLLSQCESFSRQVAIASEGSTCGWIQSYNRVGFARIEGDQVRQFESDLDLTGGNMLSRLTISGDGRYAAVGTENGTAIFLRLHDYAAYETSRCTESRMLPCRAIAMSGDGRWVCIGLMSPVIGNYTGHVLLWNGRKRTTEMGNVHNDYVSAVAVIGNPPRIASASANGEVWIWSPEQEGPPVQAATVTSQRILALDFHPSQKWLAVGGADQWLRIYDTEAGKFVSGLRVFEHSILACRFSPDGRSVAALSAGIGTPTLHAIRLAGRWE